MQQCSYKKVENKYTSVILAIVREPKICHALLKTPCNTTNKSLVCTLSIGIPSSVKVEVLVKALAEVEVVAE